MTRRTSMFTRARTGPAVLAVLMACSVAACGSGGSNGDGVTAGDPDGGATDAGGATDGDSGAGPVEGGGTGGGTGGDTGGNTGFTTSLAPLPDPPLTEGPSADDEPVAFDAVFHTITDYAVVRDTGPRVEPFIVAELTEDDFAAGLPDPVISVPPGVNPETNAAPFFEGLTNVRVEAGELLEIRYVPIDPDAENGAVPGISPVKLPEGATLVDNFDSTRTLRWQTYQEDEGINEVIIEAIDSVGANYRSSQTLLVAVDPPSDPSTVPNIAPHIEEVDRYTVRQGDPVSVFLIGRDRNGTTPTIELLDPPATAILTPDARTPEWEILQVVPDTVGELVINVLTRDEVDPALTGLDQIVLDVRAPEDFARDGVPLRDAASGTSVMFGSAVSPVFYLQADGGVYESIASTEFGVLTPESSLKWISINPVPGRFEWADMDNLVTFAQFNSMLVRGHPLIWHNSLPDWVEQTDAADREVHMREYITRVMQRYVGDITWWDVVNEPMAEDGSSNLRDSLWFEAMGEDYIDIALRQARELDPTGTLLINEFDIGFSSPKFDGLLALIDRLIERDVPLDGIGFQMHVSSSYDQFDELAANMAAIAERGLAVHVTELDVAMNDGDDLATQASVYQGVIDTCLAQPACEVLQTWGFTDRYSFRSFVEPLYFDENYDVKPAYPAIQDALGGGQ